MNNDKRQALVALHGAVLLFALSGLFAKWLILPATFIVLGRALFAAFSIGIFIKFVNRHSLACDRKALLAFASTGAILAFHWASFFHAIQISSVAIGLITFASFPLFVSLIEPFLFKEKFYLETLIQALLTIFGIYLVLPQHTLQSNDVQGVAWGVLSAFSFALLTLMNRKFVVKQSAKKVAFYQNSFAAICLLPITLFTPAMLTVEQVSALLALGVVFTALAHSLFNFSLKSLKAQTASVAVSLEPIYGIVAAYLLLNEPLTLLMIIGGCIVLATNIWALRN